MCKLISLQLSRILLLLRISSSPPLHLRFILLVALQIDFQRFCDWEKIDTLLFKPLHPFGSSGFGSVDAEDFDAVAGRSDMKIPIPRTSHIGRLRIQGVIPASSNQLKPNSFSLSALF